IADLSKQLTDAEGTRLSLQSRYRFLGEKPHGDLLAYFLDRPGLQKLHLALLDIREQRAGLEGRLGPRHPQVQELRRQQAEIEAQLRAEVEQEVAAIRTRYDAAKLSEDDLRRKLDEVGAKAVELRDLGARYQLLKNNVDSAHGLHASLLKQRMDTGVNAALVASNVRSSSGPRRRSGRASRTSRSTSPSGCSPGSCSPSDQPSPSSTSIRASRAAGRSRTCSRCRRSPPFPTSSRPGGRRCGGPMLAGCRRRATGTEG